MKTTCLFLSWPCYLLAVPYIQELVCICTQSEGSSVLPYSSHLNTAVLVHKSRYVTSTWLQWSNFTQSSCLLFSTSKAAGGMGSILLDHWREQDGVAYPKLGRIPGQPLLCIKHHLLRPEGLFSGKPSAEQGWHRGSVMYTNAYIYNLKNQIIAVLNV